jgi:ABC-type uncharacterized transport system auxiliary subunit
MMKTPSSKLIMLIIGLVSLQMITGCAAPIVPQDRYYRIDVSSIPSGPVRLSGVVEIDRFSAVGLTAGRSIVYTNDDADLVLQEYNYDFWHEPPSVMLRDVLISYMRGGNVATTITTPEMRADVDFILTGRVQRLETRRGTSPKAVVELELGVSNARNGSVLMVKSYRTDVPATDGSVEAAVVAANQAIADIFSRFVNDLR